MEQDKGFSTRSELRLTQEEARNVLDNGTLLGYSDSVKDTYWSVHTHDGKFFIALMKEAGNMWWVTEEDANQYIDEPA